MGSAIHIPDLFVRAALNDRVGMILAGELARGELLDFADQHNPALPGACRNHPDRDFRREERPVLLPALNRDRGGPWCLCLDKSG
jgi:hypothetical protein